MDVNTKIYKRFNDFDIVTSHRCIGARWKGDGTLNLGLQPVDLKTKGTDFLVHNLECIHGP